MVQVDYNKWGFVSRALKGSLTKETSFTLSSGLGILYPLEFISNYKNNFSCIDDFTKKTNDEIFPSNKNSDVLLVAGVDSKLRDQLFYYNGIEKILGPKYKEFNLFYIPNSSHNGFLYDKRYIKPVREQILK